MGTVLSISPIVTKGTILKDGGDGKTEKSLKKPSVVVSTLTFKRLVTASCQKKSAKKVSPNPLPLPASSDSQVEHLNQENSRKSQQSEKKTKTVPLVVPIPTVPPNLDQDRDLFTPAAKQLVSVQKQTSSQSLVSPRQVIVQASTGELLRCLGEFLCKRCCKVRELTPNEVVLWFRNVDRTLLLQGWQDQGFITPANLVFVYLLVRETVSQDIDSSHELHGTFLACLYLAYSYMGNEISYPLKPFMVDTNQDVFWERSLDVIDKLSGKMLQINMDPHFFTEVFQDLKTEGDYKKDAGELDR
ncbi:cyclin-dependent kinase 5 activator 1-like [Carassius carassius]|uniref:cyclin-dependent kinase 5 activator 1-like n=1 Tax=Carassius carassius TaxID=217509 RepID=UPI002868D324|nr:cyclin-dependent kinase 5 activator 1-like [Carassius carassius]